MTTSNNNPVVGFRFRPTDEELIRYLLKFVSCKSFSFDHIRVENLYGNKKPWDLFENNFLGDDTKVNYFFTKLKRTKPGGSRFSRGLIGGGCWKGLDKHKPVFKGSKLVGFKKSFRYLEKDKSSVDQGIVWNMKEYSLNDNILKVLRQRNIIQHEDYVLCCIKRKTNDHKELGDDMEIAESGNNVVAVMLSTTDQEHEINYVTTSSEDQGTGFHDLCPSNQFSSSEHNNAFYQLQLVDVQAQNIEEIMAPSVQSHVEYVGSSSTTSNQFTYCSPDNNGFQLQQYHSNIECDDRATVPSTLPETMNNIDHADKKVYEYIGSTAEPQLPICIDESRYEQNIMCPMAQGNSTAMVNAGFVSNHWAIEQVHNIEERAPITFTDMLTSSDYHAEPSLVNEENINAGFVSDHCSTEYQVQNIEERAPISYTDMLTSSDYYAEPSLVISIDECFTMDELLGCDDDDVIAADLSWLSSDDHL